MLSERVIRDLEDTHGWTRDVIAALTPYYFATLDHMDSGRSAPVYAAVDAVWHAHILCTRDYAAFCAERYGRFIHHERTDADLPGDTELDFFREYGLSLAGLEAIFGNETIGIARCAPNEPEPPRLQDVLARCTSPQPPNGKIALLGIARCAQPPSTPTERPIDGFRLGIASCGQPNEPPKPLSGVGQSIAVAGGG